MPTNEKKSILEDGLYIKQSDLLIMSPKIDKHMKVALTENMPENKLYDDNFNEIRRDHGDMLIKHCKTRRQIAIALAASFIELFFGFSSSVMITTSQKMINGDLGFQASKGHVTQLTNYSSTCVILGPFIFTYFIKCFGRKRTMSICMIPLMVQYIGVYLSEDLNHLITVVSFGYIPLLILTSLVRVYISEIISPHLRGSMNFFPVFAAHFGQLVGMLTLWVIPLKLGCLIFFTISVIYSFFIFYLPESPYFFIQKHEYSKARKVLTSMYDEKIANFEVNRLTRCINDQNERQKSSRFLDIFTTSRHRKPFLILLNLFFLKFFSGGAVMTWFSIVLLNEGKYKYLSPTLCEVMTEILTLLSIFLGSMLLIRVQRKVLSLLAFCSTLFSLSLFVIYFYLKNHEYSFILDIYDFLPFFLIVAFKCTASIGTSTMVFVYYRELISIDHLLHITFMFDIIIPVFQAFCVRMFNYLRTEYSYEASFGVFFVCTFVSTIIYYVYTPETKNEVLEDVQKEFETSDA